MGAAALPSFQIALLHLNIKIILSQKVRPDQLNTYYVGTRNANIQMRLHRKLGGQTQLFRQTATVQDGIWAEFHVTHG